MLDLLRIQLLGTFQLSYQEGVITTLNNAPRLQSLLAFLVLHPDTTHGRPQLARLFWPASTPGQARTNLRKLLYQLRIAIPQPEQYLLLEDNNIRWHPDAAYFSDVADLHRLLAQSEHDPLNDQSLEEAVALYRGELLPAVYDDWVLPLRHELHAKITQALAQLIRFRQKQTAYAAAIEYTQQLLAMEPYSEAYYRWLIQLQAQNGDRVGAIQTYQTCVAMLRNELKLSPSPETASVYQQLIENKPIVLPDYATAKSPVSLPHVQANASRNTELRRPAGTLPSPGPEPNIKPSRPAFLEAESQAAPPQQVGFVGREREMEELNRFLDTAVAGETQFVFVSGDAGQGKTTLMTEFARHAQAHHPELLVASGACNVYSGIGDPYLPFRDIFAMLSADVEASWEAGLISREHALRLWTALPDMVEALLARGTGLLNVLVDGSILAAHVAAAMPDETEKLKRLWSLSGNNGGSGHSLQQNLLFEQCANVFRLLSQRRPLLLILDDLQWVDAASLSLLFHLGRRLVGCRLLLVGTYRPAAVALRRGGERHPLASVLNEFRRLRGNILIELDKSSNEAGQAFVNQMLDQIPNRLGDNFRQALFKLTAGNPLYTTEVIRDMQERYDLVPDESGNWVESSTLDWTKLPERVEGVIAERIGRVGDDLRQTLDVACIQGETFTAEVVAHVRDLAERRLIRQLSHELERTHRLISEHGRLHLGQQRLSFYAFRHSLFQGFLYGELGDTERIYLHEEVGRTLEMLYGVQRDKVAVQCARHFELARNREKAVEYLQLAGDRAWCQYAHEEAIAHFSHALNLLPENDAARRFEMLSAREKVYGLTGERDRQSQDLSEMEALAEALADPKFQAEVALRQAIYADARGELPAAIHAAQRAVRLAQTAKNAKLEAAGLYQWGKALWRKEEDFETARGQIARALTLAQQEQLSVTGVTSLYNLGVVQEVARIQLEKALVVAKEAQAPRVEADSLYTLGVVTLILGDIEGAKTSYEQALIKHRAIGNTAGEAQCLSNLGALSLVIEGDPVRAEAYDREALSLYQAMGDRQHEANLLGNLGDVAFFKGNYNRARENRIQSLAILKEIGARRELGFCLKELGVIDLNQSKYGQAGRNIERALAIFRELDEPRGERMTLVYLGILERTLGDYDEAGACFETALAMYRDAGLRGGQGWVSSEIGLLYHQLGAYEAARAHCQEAVALLREAKSNPDLLAAALTRQAYALTGLEAYSSAIELFEEARQIRLTLTQFHLTIEPLAGLAQATLDQGNVTQAINYVAEISDYLHEGGLHGMALPGQIYLTCFQILQASAGPRAANLLAEAYEWVRERVRSIDDEAKKKMFLENVPAHRAIAAAYSNHHD